MKWIIRMSKILIAMIVCLATALFSGFSAFAQTQDFKYKNQVWAYPDCNVESNIRIWSEDGNDLVLHVLSEKGLMTNKIMDLRQSAGKTTFNYEKAGASETYTFSGNTARTMDRVVDGKVLIKDGVIQATNLPSFNYQSCDKNSAAGKAIIAKIPMALEAQTTEKPSKVQSSNNVSAPTGNQPSTSAKSPTLIQFLDGVDAQVRKNPKLAQAAVANFNIGTYGICSNVGIAVMAGDVKGQKYSQETLFMTANFIKLADVYRKQAIANGIPSSAFESSLQSSHYVGDSQVEWEKGLQRCASLLNEILIAAK